MLPLQKKTLVGITKEPFLRSQKRNIFVYLSGQEDISFLLNTLLRVSGLVSFFVSVCHSLSQQMVCGVSNKYLFEIPFDLLRLVEQVML